MLLKHLEKIEITKYSVCVQDKLWRTKTTWFFDEIEIDHTFLRLIAENIILDSLAIIHHRIYSLLLKLHT